MRALPIWILAKQRLSLCLHKYFLIATSVTFFFFQFSLIILIWQMILVFFSYKDANTNSNQCAYCVPSNFLSTCCELTLHVLVHLLLTSVLQMGKLRKEVHSLFQGHTANKAMVSFRSSSSITGASWLPNYTARKFYF